MSSLWRSPPKDLGLKHRDSPKHGKTPKWCYLGECQALGEAQKASKDNGLKRTNDVPPAIAHMYTCGRAKSCTFWGQKVPPEHIFKPKTSVKWCLMRYVCTQCGRERHFCDANCIGDHLATSVRRKSKKSKKKHLLGNTHTPSNHTKRENKLYEKVVTTYGGMSTLRNGVEWIVTWVACAQHMLCCIFVTSGHKIHEHGSVAKK